MIVRIQGSGQYRLGESEVEALEALDSQLVETVHARDEAGVHRLLHEMIVLVQSKGACIDDAELVPSDTILPPDTLTVEEVQALLHEEGLVSKGVPIA